MKVGRAPNAAKIATRRDANVECALDELGGPFPRSTASENNDLKATAIHRCDSLRSGRPREMKARARMGSRRLEPQCRFKGCPDVTAGDDILIRVTHRANTVGGPESFVPTWLLNAWLLFS